MIALSGPVEDFLYEQIPPEVWHYTTIDGLQGILSSGTIWATEARSTRDKTEFVHARDIALEYLKTAERLDEHFEFALAEALEVVESVFDEGALSVNKTEVFLASFSAAEDLKTQWEYYGDHDHGVSIAFDLRNIRRPKGSGNALTVARCIYEQAEKVFLIQSSLSHFVQMCANSHRIASYRRQRDEKLRVKFKLSFARTSFDLLRLASHCKHRKYSAEKEWRLAIPRLKSRIGAVTPVEYRGLNGAIPFIQCKLIQPSGRLPITRVMLGPLCTIRKDVEKLLSDNGYGVPVIGSSIPLRNSA
jgi:hypothetical protein